MPYFKVPKQNKPPWAPLFHNSGANNPAKPVLMVPTTLTSYINYHKEQI
jgi:hypothetical protein